MLRWDCGTAAVLSDTWVNVGDQWKDIDRRKPKLEAGVSPILWHAQAAVFVCHYNKLFGSLLLLNLEAKI
jgi:hypothetical protein